MKILHKIITHRSLQGKFASRHISALFGFLADRNLPKPLLRWLIKKYIAAFEINMEDYDGNIEMYQNFNAFFTRKFKAGARFFADEPAAPAEGFIVSGGDLLSGKLLQVKGNQYPLQTLIDEKPTFQQGFFCTIFLSLADYHRVHAPMDCTLERIKYIPGNLFASNPEALTQKKNIYCTNERLILMGKSNFGRFYLCLIGATCVGRIKSSFLPAHSKKGIFIPERQIKLGEELAYFEMGSTVILILESNNSSSGIQRIKMAKAAGEKILLGEKLWE